MKLTIDTEKKTVEVEQGMTFTELLKTLNAVMWGEYDVVRAETESNLVYQKITCFDDFAKILTIGKNVSEINTNSNTDFVVRFYKNGNPERIIIEVGDTIVLDKKTGTWNVLEEFSDSQTFSNPTIS